MNFRVDAQIPRRMTEWLTAAGCEAGHTLDLPDGNRTERIKVDVVPNSQQNRHLRLLLGESTGNSLRPLIPPRINRTGTDYLPIEKATTFGLEKTLAGVDCRGGGPGRERHP